MIGGKERIKLSKEAILSKIDDYNIIRFYLGQDPNFKKRFHSPLREEADKTPNLRFFAGHDGKILFKDFATGVGGDCFKFVQEMHKLNFRETLVKIDKDLGLGIQSFDKPKFKASIIKRPDSIHKQKIIQIIPRSFTPEELAYWSDYQITEDELVRKDVYGIEKLYLNKQLIPNYKKELRFAYKFDDYLKIYSPMSKEFKWLSSCPNDFISNFDNIKYKIFSGTQDKKLIISKSVKDELVLSKFFKDVCSTQNESFQAITPENIQWILKGYKPEDVYIAYDNDEAGIKASKYFTENYGFKYVNVPKIYRREGIKDWADLVKLKGLDTMENYLKIKKLI